MLGSVPSITHVFLLAFSLLRGNPAHVTRAHAAATKRRALDNETHIPFAPTRTARCAFV